MEASRPHAFVLMPFDPDSDSLYEDLIKRPLEEVGYAVNRADSVLNQRNVLTDIVRGIDRADLIVADLTGLNSNVFYELGIAHALGVPTILITQSIDEVPFDLLSYRAREYSTRYDEAEGLKGHLKAVGDGRAQGKLEFGSPVADFLPESAAKARLESSQKEALSIPSRSPEGQYVNPATGQETTIGRGEVSPPGETSSGDEDGDEEEGEGEPGLLDLLDSVISENEKSTELMQRIEEATNTIGAEVEGHTERINEVAASPGPGQIAKARRIAADVARDIEKYAEVLEGVLPELESSNNRMTTDGIMWVQRVPISAPDQPDILEFIDILGQLYDAAETSSEQISEYRDSLETSKGMSRTLDTAIAHATALLDRLIVVIENTQSYASRAQGIAQERFHSMHFVAEPKVDCFADAEGEQKHDFQAVLLASAGSDGVEQHAYPHTGPPLPRGSPVTWEWMDQERFPETWWRHPETGELIYGWTDSMGFDGKPYNPEDAVKGGPTS
jgi:hypothetical protein